MTDPFVRATPPPAVATLRVARGHGSRGYSPNCGGESTGVPRATCSRGTCGRAAVRSTAETNGVRCLTGHFPGAG